MGEYFNVLTNVAYRVPRFPYNNEILMKLIEFLQNSCKLNCILNRERNRSESIDNPSELWSYPQSISTKNTSLIDDSVINSVLKLLIALLPSMQPDTSPNAVTISEEDFTALINIVVFMTLCPWNNTTSSVTFVHFVEPIYSLDISLLSGVLIKCLNLGACRPIITRFISISIKHLTLYIGSSCADRLQNGCQQLFAVITSLLRDVKDDRLVFALVSDVVLEQIIPLLRLNPIYSMQFLIEHIRVGSTVYRPLERANEHFVKWLRENLRRWVRPLLVAHDQLQTRTKTRHLLLCCIPIEELHGKPDAFSVTSNPQPSIKISEPVRISRTLPISAIDDLRTVVKFVYSILRDIDNELFAQSERSSRNTMSTGQHDKASIDNLSLEEHVEQLFEFLVFTLIGQEMRDLFKLSCATVWRMYRASCRATSQAYLANRLLILSYVYHCIRDNTSNTDLFLSHTESVAEDVIKSPLLLNYDDRDMLPYNRSYLLIAFGCIYQCACSSEAFSHALVFRQLPAWSIRFMNSKGTFYNAVVQQITSFLKLLLSTTPNELYSSLTFIEEVKTTLLNQIVKATFENSFAKSFLLAANTVLSLLMRTPLFSVERVVECIMCDNNIQLLSVLSDIFQLDHHSAIFVLTRVLAAIPDNQIPIWSEIESVLGYMRHDIYRADVIRCVYQMLQRYPNVARTVSRNLLEESVPDNVINSTTVTQSPSDSPPDEQDAKTPMFDIVHMICTSPKLDNFLSKEDRIEISIHFAHVYPEFLLSFKVCDLRELDVFYDWMAGIVSSDNSDFLHSTMRNPTSADLKFADVFLSALENEKISPHTASNPSPLDEQVSEMLLRALECKCFDVRPSSRLLGRLQQTISSLNSPTMTARFRTLCQMTESSDL